MEISLDKYQDKIQKHINILLPTSVALEDLPQVLQSMLTEFITNNISEVIQYLGYTKRVTERDAFFKKHLEPLVSSTGSEIPGSVFWIGDKEALLDVSSGLVWSAYKTDGSHSVDSFQEEAGSVQNGSFYSWELPSAKNICHFARMPSNPLGESRNFYLLGHNFYLTTSGCVDLGYADSRKVSVGETSRVLPISKKYSEHIDDLVIDCLLSGKDLVSANGSKLNITDHLFYVPDLASLLSDLDSYSQPAPWLDQRQISDQACGLWEFWSDPSIESGKKANSACLNMGIRPRNPVDDIQSGSVAIDFGTSSTVVAFKDGGRKKLLRIGLSVDDFNADSQPEHYENPTILEFVDLDSLMDSWRSQAYRPRVSWDDVHCSHEALSSQRDNESDPRVTASILPKIKQWALRMEDDLRVRVQDQENQRELELPALSKRNPVKGEALSVSEDDPFDPIELYAWFLGLAINQRSRGIFLKYNMTFPVAYPKNVKEKILSSFRRGLQRSLPASLIGQPEFDKFSVEERASEPAAFAVAALEHLKLEPTEQGVAYGVFDFGGGTTDFDFGLYRLPTEEEEDHGHEQVLEHFGSSGDKFLGGENLLENMAYLVFQHNLEVCRNEKITFSKPLDADDFPASETLLSNNQAAVTNTQMLMARLRPFWEKGEQNEDGIEKLLLVGKEGSIQVDLSIPYSLLLDYLNERLSEGVNKFLHTMNEAFQLDDKQPETIHIFLAGNASRSELLQSMFGLNGEDDFRSELGVTLKVSDLAPGLPVTANSIDLEVGEEVEAGEPLFTLFEDTGKVEVLSPVDGWIEKIHFTCDAEISSDMPLIEFRVKKGAAVPAGFTTYLLGETKNMVNELPVTVHPPIKNDPNSPYSPNTKTGVALGLLDLYQGSPTAIVNHSACQQGGEAPFGFFVGAIKRRMFAAGLKRHANFSEWQELGPVREQIFRLVYTQNPIASSGEMPQEHIELEFKELEMPVQGPGYKVFAKALSSSAVELCTSRNREAFEKGEFENSQRLELV